MGRRRTHRAAQKLITNIHRKLDGKRNRQKHIKNLREKYRKQKTEQIKRNQAILDSYDTTKRNEIVKKSDKKMNPKFRERAYRAQTSYVKLVDEIDDSDGIIQVLDARDPHACRFINFEEEVIKEKEKKFVFIINKADLVPSSITELWIKYLCVIAPTFAVSAIDKSHAESLSAFVKDNLSDCKKILVSGPPFVGKTTLCGLLGKNVTECTKWEWTICGVTLDLIDSIPWKGREREYIVDFFERLVDSNKIFALLDIEPQKSIGDTLRLFGNKNDVGKHDVPHLLIEKLKKEFKWATTPADVVDGEISPNQLKVLKSFVENYDDFLIINQGNTIIHDSKALNADIVDSEEEEDYDEDLEDGDVIGEEEEEE